MRPSITLGENPGKGHFYFAQTGHFYFALTELSWGGRRKVEMSPFSSFSKGDRRAGGVRVWSCWEFLEVCPASPGGRRRRLRIEPGKDQT
jgi:hypothetical protein